MQVRIKPRGGRPNFGYSTEDSMGSVQFAKPRSLLRLGGSPLRWHTRATVAIIFKRNIWEANGRPTILYCCTRIVTGKFMTKTISGSPPGSSAAAVIESYCCRFGAPIPTLDSPVRNLIMPGGRCPAIRAL